MPEVRRAAAADRPKGHEPEAAHVVVGTAGHVDHGKTALVRALTGVDTDRLPEEKARGITIELGFARWPLGGGLEASVIDVPGHERFVGTMVAGAAGIDCVLLVVAADDGVMPQTREHVAICQLLGVARGVVAIAKRELAAEDVLELVEQDVREATRGTFLETAEVVRCSARTGDGLEALAAAALRACRAAPATTTRHAAYLAIDRVFSRPGAGTVVTGTLVRGTIALEDEIEVVPAGVRARVRAMEVHGTKRDRVSAPTRLALNLRGEDAAGVRRGAALVAPGSTLPTTSFHARLQLLDGARPIGRRAAMRLHAGTAAHDVEVVLLDRAELSGGAAAIARIRTAAPAALFAGQRFVVRRPERGRAATIGGGVVADPHPLRERRRARPPFFVAPDATARMRALVAEARWAGIATDDARRRCPAEDDVGAALDALVREGAVVREAGRVFDAARLEEAKAGLLALVVDLHRERPLATGISGAEIETRAPPRMRPLAAAALAALAATRELLREDGLFAARAHVEAAAGRATTLEAIAGRLREAKLGPPSLDVVRAELALEPTAFRDAVAELRRTGRLRSVGELVFDAAALGTLREDVARWFATHASLTPVAFKDLCGGITRRHAIPLLEWLDREGMTARDGDARVPGPAAKRVR